MTLAFPGLPEELRRLKILHITDVHIRGHRRAYERLVAAVGAAEHDVLALTGDIMDDLGDEPVAFEAIIRLLQAARPRLGVFGVHGNHDSHELRRRLAHLPVRWLDNSAFVHPTMPLNILGVDCQESERSAPRGDLMAALLDERRGLRLVGGEQRRFRLLLAHIPNWLPAAAEAGIDLMLTGHTHGGQMRLPGLDPVYNATPDWPMNLTSGLLRCGRTTAVVSRGVGESYMDGLRLFCPPQAPLITLEREEAVVESPPRGVVCIKRW